MINDNNFRKKGSKDYLEDNPLRSDLLIFIRSNPGCIVEELSRVFNKTPQTITYHIRTLERNSLIKKIKKDKNNLIYDFDHPIMNNIRFSNYERIYNLFSSRITLTQNDIITTLKIPQPTTSRILKRMIKEKIIKRTIDDNSIYNIYQLLE